MHLNNLANTYLRCFYYLGQGAYKPVDTEIRHGFVVAKRNLPTFAYFAIASFTISLQLISLPETDFAFNTIVYILLIICSLLLFAVVIRQTLISNNRAKCVWPRFVGFERFAAENVRMEFHFKSCTRLYNRRVCTIITLYLFVVCAKFYTNITVTAIKRKVSFLTSLLLTLIVSFHVLFYVSVLGHLMYLFNRHVIGAYYATSKYENSNESIKIFVAHLKVYRKIHYKLWDLAHSISDHFGWLLILLIVHNVNNATQTMFWITINLYEVTTRRNYMIST